MHKLGIIGTNWISVQFIDAALATKKWELGAVYSRKIEKAGELTARYGGFSFDDLDQFFGSSYFDTVYIASPNSLHFQQAIKAIAAGKNVIIEKPAVSNPEEFKALQIALTNHPDLFYFEAARHIHEPNFKKITEIIQAWSSVDGAVLNYAKYSSRYDAVLAGEEPNVFSLSFAGGALQDLGVYLVYDAISWFGVPDKAVYYPTKIATGADGAGTAILSYPTFNVTLLTGKTIDSTLPSEIYSGKSTLWIDNAGTFNEVKISEGDSMKVLSSAPKENPMVEEANVFADIMTHNDQNQYQQLLKLSEQVNQVLFELRQSANIKFAFEPEEELH